MARVTSGHLVTVTVSSLPGLGSVHLYSRRVGRWDRVCVSGLSVWCVPVRPVPCLCDVASLLGTQRVPDAIPQATS